MTEIRIERKAAVWPRIVGLLLLVLVGDDERAAEQTVMDPPAERAGDPRPAGTTDGLPQPV